MSDGANIIAAWLAMGGCSFGKERQCSNKPAYRLGGKALCREHAEAMCKIVPAAREKLTPWGREEGDDERAR